MCVIHIVGSRLSLSGTGATVDIGGVKEWELVFGWYGMWIVRLANGITRKGGFYKLRLNN